MLVKHIDERAGGHRDSDKATHNHPKYTYRFCFSSKHVSHYSTLCNKAQSSDDIIGRMRSRKTKELHRQRVRRAAVLLLLIALLLVVARWAWGSFQTHYEARAMLDQIETKNLRLENRLNEVETRNRLFTTSTGKQDFMVERQGMIRRGERVLILVEEDRRGVDITEQEEEKRSWWQRLWGSD